MAIRISASELDRQMNEILNRVYYRRESFIVERFGKEMACIEPVGPSRFATAEEIADRLGDLRVPEGLADALEEIQKNQPMAEFPEWP